jgi:hypothetical protein
MLGLNLSKEPDLNPQDFMMHGTAMQGSCQKQGTHHKTVQERLGHASVQITLNTYSHVAPRLQEAAGGRFDHEFDGRYNEHERGFAGENNANLTAKADIMSSKNWDLG